MAETLSVLKIRLSCLAFKPELIEEENLKVIIEAGPILHPVWEIVSDHYRGD